MFLRKKKGDMVVQFVVLLVAALIMVFVVLSYGAKIWGAIFPSDDKSTTKSLDTFYSLIAAKAASPLDYEMTPYVLYLKKGYCIVLFDKPIVDVGSEKAYAPADCKNQQCICLYDGYPSYKEGKKEKNVMKCATLPSPVNVNQSYFDVKGRVCPSDNQQQYRPYLVIRRTENNIPYIYIINDNASNRKLDETWNVPICTNDATSMCYGKKDGTVVTFNDEVGLKRIYDFCGSIPGKNFSSTSVTCNYDKTNRNCQIDCASGDVSLECGAGKKYSTCNDINQLSGIKKYISMSTDYRYYRMCVNDAEYCNLGCQVNQWDVYISKDTNSPDGTALYSMIDSNAILKDCDIKYIDGFQGKYGRFVSSYNISKQTCVDEINKYFYPNNSTMLACKNTTTECQNFINSRKTTCSLKYLNNGNIFWITYYDKTDSACDIDVNKFFGTAYFCSSKP